MTRIPPGAVRAAIAAAEAGPAPGDLADAPVMRDWSVATYPGGPEIWLHGRVEGYPTIDDPTVTTSLVLAINAGDELLPWNRRE